MSNLVVHFEIHGSEPERLVDFYSDLLGWRFTQFGDTPYWIIETGEGSVTNTGQPGVGINGGLTQRQGPRPETSTPVNGCNIVVAAENVDELMRRAVELGGAEVMAAEDMEGVGRVGYLQDPDGNLFGLIAPVMPGGQM